MSGSLEGRVLALRRTLLGNKKYVSQTVTIPANTLVTMTNIDALNSKTIQEGDVVRFAVADDICVGDVIAIPAVAGSADGDWPPRPEVRASRATAKRNHLAITSVDYSSAAALDGQGADERRRGAWLRCCRRVRLPGIILDQSFWPAAFSFGK